MFERVSRPSLETPTNIGRQKSWGASDHSPLRKWRVLTDVNGKRDGGLLRKPVIKVSKVE